MRASTLPDPVRLNSYAQAGIDSNVRPISEAPLLVEVSVLLLRLSLNPKGCSARRLRQIAIGLSLESIGVGVSCATYTSRGEAAEVIEKVQSFKIGIRQPTTATETAQRGQLEYGCKTASSATDLLRGVFLAR